MKKYLKYLLIFILPFFLAVFAGCGNDSNQQGNSGLPRLTVATMPSIDKVPMLVAVDKGFFQGAGVEVEVLNFQSPTDRNAALQSGQLNGIMSDMVADVLYLDAGMKLKMTSLIQTDFVVLASPQSGIQSFADITPAHSNGIALNCLIEYIADKAGPSEKILLPNVMNRVEQIIANKIDLAIVPEPYGTMAVKRGAVKVGTANDLNIYCAAMIFTEETIANQPEAIHAFYQGYQKAVDYLAAASPNEYMDYVINKGEFSPEAADVIAATQFVPLKALSLDQYTAVLAWMNQHPEFQGPYNYDFAQITDFQFLQ